MEWDIELLRSKKQPRNERNPKCQMSASQFSGLCSTYFITPSDKTVVPCYYSVLMRAIHYRAGGFMQLIVRTKKIGLIELLR